MAVLDISAAALARAKARLGPLQHVVRWIEADVTGDWESPPVDIWHDRAAFHFLTEAEDRARYVARLRQTLRPGGSLIAATFALDGPPRCSGLPVIGYSAATLGAQIGPEFVLMETVDAIHRTPRGVPQPFCHSRFVRRLDVASPARHGR